MSESNQDSNFSSTGNGLEKILYISVNSGKVAEKIIDDYRKYNQKIGGDNPFDIYFFKGLILGAAVVPVAIFVYAIF